MSSEKRYDPPTPERTLMRRRRANYLRAKQRVIYLLRQKIDHTLLSAKYPSAMGDLSSSSMPSDSGGYSSCGQCGYGVCCCDSMDMKNAQSWFRSGPAAEAEHALEAMSIAPTGEADPARTFYSPHQPPPPSHLLPPVTSSAPPSSTESSAASVTSGSPHTAAGGHISPHAPSPQELQPLEILQPQQSDLQQAEDPYSFVHPAHLYQHHQQFAYQDPVLLHPSTPYNFAQEKWSLPPSHLLLPQTSSIHHSSTPPTTTSTMAAEAEMAFVFHDQKPTDFTTQLLQHDMLYQIPRTQYDLYAMQPPVIFDQYAAATSGTSHLGLYEQAYASSPSCGGSAFSIPHAVVQAAPPSSYTPPPQDPSLSTGAGPSMGMPRIQKKRIQAVSCHSNSICANCDTRDTSLWRRNNTGEIECNACNLYFRKNGRKRPISLRKGVIMKRNRKPRSGDA